MGLPEIISQRCKGKKNPPDINRGDFFINKTLERMNRNWCHKRLMNFFICRNYFKLDL